jgi:hypothetical protein
METIGTFSPQRRHPIATGRTQNVPIAAVVNLTDAAEDAVEKRRFVSRNRSDMALRLEQTPMRKVRDLIDPQKRTSTLKEIQECSKEYTLPCIKKFVSEKKTPKLRSFVVLLAGILIVRQFTALRGFSWLSIQQNQPKERSQQQGLKSSSLSTATTTTSSSQNEPQITYPDDRTVMDILSIVQSIRETSTSTNSSTSSSFSNIQKKYLSSHRHVRNYISFDRDLSEPNCAATLTKTHIIKVIDSCSRTDSQSYISSQIRKSLFQPKLDIAWMCTQLRILDGVYEYLKQYGNHLPEYLILTSDSTFLDMEELVHEILMKYNDTASVIPHVIAGCKQGDPQFEHADVLQSGLILSKRALEKFIQPLDCDGENGIPKDNHNDHAIGACWRLRVPAFRERDYYYAQSSILDVMHEFAIANAFTRVDTWGDAADQNIGFCWSGSHALSYFINFYFLPVPDGVITRGYNGVVKDKIRKRHPMHNLGYCDAKCHEENTKICGDLTAKQLLRKFQENPHYGGVPLTNTDGVANSDRDTLMHGEEEEEENVMIHKSLPKPEEEKKEIMPLSMEDAFTIDVISIGDTSRSDYQEMQQETIGTMVRNFYRVTEYDDFDRTCTNSVSSVEKVLNVCANLRDHSHIAETMNKRLFRPAKDDVNALCAQKRLIDGLYKTLKQNYKQESDIPSYLWIIKDETYVNVPSLRDELIRHHFSQNPDEEPQSWALAGCLSHSGFTTPEFQHGMFLSKASIQKLLRPIDCEAPLEKEKGKKDKFVSHACRRLKVNAIGEKMFFQNGMSLIDWMHEFSSKLLYSKVDGWLDAGFCFHSEHFLAYFVNFYRVSDSHSFLGLWDDENRCIKTNKEEIKCEIESKICNRVDPRDMKRLFRVQAAAEKKRRKKAKKKYSRM